jgi:hypothetical protein
MDIVMQETWRRMSGLARLLGDMLFYHYRARYVGTLVINATDDIVDCCCCCLFGSDVVGVVGLWLARPTFTPSIVTSSVQRC